MMDMGNGPRLLKFNDEKRILEENEVVQLTFKCVSFYNIDYGHCT